MANTTVYPYGTGGSLPASIGIINDLKTGGVDKALSAEMGKYLGDQVDGTPGNYTPNVNLDSSAAYVNDNSSIVSDFAPCPPGATLIWHHGYASEQNAKSICFYNENKEYITGQYYGATVATERTITLGTNQNIRYVRASFNSLEEGTFLKVNDVEVWRRAYGTEGLVQAIAEKASATQLDNLEDGAERSYVIGQLYIDSSSALINTTIAKVSYGTSHNIYCNPGDVITWDAGRPSGSATDEYLLVCYSSSGYITSYYAKVGGSRNIIAPQNCVRLKMTFKIGSNAYLQVNGVEMWREQAGTAPARSNEVVIYGEGKYNVWNSGYAHAGTGAFASSAINSRTGFIDVGDYKLVKFIMSRVVNRSDAGFCFYKADGTFINSIYANANANYTAQQDYEWRVAEVPALAKYAVASIYTAIRDHFAINGIRKDVVSTDAAASKTSLADEYVNRIVVGAPQLYLSGTTSEAATSLNAKTVAELYAEYDALVSGYPLLFKREIDLGTVTRSSDSATFAVRSYTLGYNAQMTIDHEPTATEVLDSSDNVWNLGLPRKLLAVSGMHGDEKTPTWGLMLAVKDILENDEPWANFIKMNAIIKIVPCLNPVGWEACTRADSQGHVLNRLEAISDPEYTMYMNWIGANSDAFILLDFHGSQGRYAYMPVMDKCPHRNVVLRLANQLAPAFQANWKEFYNGQVSGYGTTYAPFLVGKTTSPLDYIATGRFSYEMLIQYGMKGFAVETPDNLTTGAINYNDLRNCKLTKDLAVNTFQFFISLPYMLDV